MANKKDEFGYKKGALGKFDPALKLKRGSFPNSRPGTDERGCGVYTSDDAGLTRTKMDPERMTNDAGRDIMDNVEKNQGVNSGAIKYGTDVD